MSVWVYLIIGTAGPIVSAQILRPANMAQHVINGVGWSVMVLAMILRFGISVC